MQTHRYANIVPTASLNHVSGLVRHIRQKGQRDPIVILDGAILDGRARYLACRRAGIEPKIETYSGDDPLLYVLERNRPRLNVSQMAMVIARAVLVFARDQRLLASKLNVSLGMTRRAVRILMTGTEDQVTSVLEGKQSVTAITDKPKAPKTKPPEEKPPRRRGRRPRCVPPPSEPESRRTTLTEAAELWSHLREAFNRLGSLPCASDAAAIIGKLAPGVQTVVDQKLPGIIKWMEEFSHEWKSGNERRQFAKSQSGSTARPAAGSGGDAHDAAGTSGDGDAGHGPRAA